MDEQRQLQNRVRARRVARGWSQEELAARAGISRTGISAIEMGRLVPSATAVLALADAFECRVEDLFSLTGETAGTESWAWEPASESCRYWHSNVRGGTLHYPVEATCVIRAHDGVFEKGSFTARGQSTPNEVLVIASCDPAVGLLASEYQRQTGFQILALQRTSRDALALLSSGLVHVASTHLESRGESGCNAAAAATAVGSNICLLRAAFWQEGLAVAPDRRIKTVQQALDQRLRWIGREASSAAGELQRKLLPDQTPKRIARSHRGVAEAVRAGWADVGVCVRLATEEAGLNFLSVREETCDLCFAEDQTSDPRVQALVETVQSTTYRTMVQDLPGYDSSETGILSRFERN